MRNLAFAQMGIPELLVRLQDPDARVRADAAEALNRRNDASAFEPLFAALSDTDGQVVNGAIQALTHLDRAQTQQRLLAAFGASNVEMRRRAAHFLYYVSGPEAFDALLAVFADTDPYVRSNLLSALQCDKIRAVAPTLAALHDEAAVVRESAVNILGMDHHRPTIERAIAPVMARLGDEEARVRAAAAYAMGTFTIYAPDCLKGTNAVEMLIGCLADAEERVREYAARGLTLLGDPRASEPLRGLLSDPQSRVREQAAQGLGRLGENEAVASITHVLETDSDAWVRKKAVQSLAQIGEKSKTARVLDALICALADTSGEVRDAAAEALYDLKGKRIFGFLLPWLGHEDAQIRAGVARALGDILSGSLFDGEEFSPRLLVPLVAPVVALLQDSSLNIRRYAAEILGCLPRRQAAASLTTALSDPAPEVRCAAAYSLWVVARKAALPALVSLLDDPDTNVRVTAAEGIDEIGGRRAVPLLCRCLHDPDSAVRRAASERLYRRADPRSLKPLLEAGKKIAPGGKEDREEDDITGSNLVHALGKIGDPRALPLLARLQAMPACPVSQYDVTEAIAAIQREQSA